jgi:hypothetical protein
LLLKEFTKVILKFNNFADFLIHDANVTYKLLLFKFNLGVYWEWMGVGDVANGLRLKEVAVLEH